MAIKETVLILSITLIVVPVTYGITLHQRLYSKVNHAKSSGELTSTHTLTKNITSIPQSAFKTPHLMIYDHAWKFLRLPAPAPASSRARQTTTQIQIQTQTQHDKKDADADSTVTEDTLTTYLRYTMSLFATRLPQAWILRKVVPASAKASFAKEHIQSLTFQEGDLACGIYRVVLRTDEQVEFELLPVPGPAARAVAGGRLVIALKPRRGASFVEGVGEGGYGLGENDGDDGGDDREDEEWILSTSTVMWKVATCRGKMPLEGGVGKWMHELASWYLLDSGSRYLVDLKGKTP